MSLAARFVAADLLLSARMRDARIGPDAPRKSGAGVVQVNDSTDPGGICAQLINIELINIELIRRRSARSSVQGHPLIPPDGVRTRH